jgi:hypothetical protein
MPPSETPRAAGQRPEGLDKHRDQDCALLGALAEALTRAAAAGDRSAYRRLWPAFVAAKAALPRALTERLDAERLARAGGGWDSSRPTAESDRRRAAS